MTDVFDGTSAALIAPIAAKSALSEPAEVLFRQVHPDLFDGGEPASSEFRPKPGDDNQLSTDRSSMTTAKDAHELYVANNRRSVGTFGVSVGEFNEHELGCFPDPIRASATNPANPAHARVDFGDFGTSQQKKIGKRLKQFAVARGILHKG